MSRIVRAVLADLPVGAIVRVDGSWVVVCIGNNSYRRIVDFWDTGRTYMRNWELVEVLV